MDNDSTGGGLTLVLLITAVILVGVMICGILLLR